MGMRRASTGHAEAVAHKRTPEKRHEDADCLDVRISQDKKCADNTLTEAVEIHEEAISKREIAAADNGQHVASQSLRKRKKKQDDNSKGRRYIAFVGQLPYDITAEALGDHFQQHANLASKIVNIRLLTDRQTGKARGMAFVDFVDAKALHTALKVHHTKLGGRRINIEKSQAGGGNNSVRKMKTVDARRAQEKQKAQQVEALVNKIISRHHGKFSWDDVDDQLRTYMNCVPIDVLQTALTEFVEERRTVNIDNRAAWLTAIIKKRHVLTDTAKSHVSSSAT